MLTICIAHLYGKMMAKEIVEHTLSKIKHNLENLNKTADEGTVYM